MPAQTQYRIKASLELLLLLLLLPNCWDYTGMISHRHLLNLRILTQVYFL